MTTRHIISPGIGFFPASVKFVVYRGLYPGEEIDPIFPSGNFLICGMIDTAGGDDKIQNRQEIDDLGALVG